MQSLINKAKRLVRGNTLISDDRGLSTVEYVIILVLIAVVAIGVWQAFGTAIMTQVGNSTSAVNGLPSQGSGAAPATNTND